MTKGVKSPIPMRIPPGTIADTSPGTVFLLAAIWTDSNTFSTLEPSIPCWTPFQKRGSYYCFIVLYFHYQLNSSEVFEIGKKNHHNLCTDNIKGKRIFGKSVWEDKEVKKLIPCFANWPRLNGSRSHQILVHSRSLATSTKAKKIELQHITVKSLESGHNNAVHNVSLKPSSELASIWAGSFSLPEQILSNYWELALGKSCTRVSWPISTYVKLKKPKDSWLTCIKKLYGLSLPSCI